MASRKKKYVEVLTPRIDCFSHTQQEVSFADVLSYMSTKTISSNDKEYIVKIYTLIPQHYNLTLFISS